MVFCSPCYATDDGERFVEALRNRGYYDLALEYLDRAASDNLASQAFRRQIPYQRSVTLLDQSKTLTDAAARREAIDQARKNLEQFVSRSSDKLLAAETKSRLAGALAEDAKLGVAKADQLIAAGDRNGAEQLLKTARRSFEDVRDLYRDAEAIYDKELDKYKAVAPNSPEAEQRLELRGRLAQARLLAARTLYLKASAYASKSSEFKKLNESAGKELAALFEKYSRWLVGFYAHLYEGQCYQALGKHNLALSCFEDLLSQPDDEPAFRRLITLAHGYRAASLISEKQHAKVLGPPSEWLNRLSGVEKGSPGGRALMYQVAVASQIEAKSDDADEPKRLLRRARNLLQDAIRGPHEFLAESRVALAEVNASLGAQRKRLDTFADAYQAGKDAMNAFSSAKLAAGVAKSNNPLAVSELEQQIEDSQQEALRAFVTALRLVEDDTPSRELNEVRRLLSWLYWKDERYYEAAVVGRFLAIRQSEDPSAEDAAKLAIASLERLYQQANSEGRDATFEANQLQELAQFVTTRWSGSEIADAAFNVLINLALQDDRLQEARDAVASVSSERRLPLELKLANAAWERAVRTAATAADADRLQARQSQESAAELLTETFDRASSIRPITPTLATAALYLSQAQIDQGKYAEAVQLLEDKEVGQLSLLRRKSDVVDRPGYAAEAYKSALRCYVSMSPPKTEQAIKTMSLLEKAVAATSPSPSTARTSLTKIYFGLGLQLQRQIADLSAAGKRQEAERVGTAFSAFLTRLDQQSSDADWTTRQWIGQTFLQLGEGLGDSAPKSRDKFFSRSRDVFQSMIDRAKQDQSYAPKPNSVLAARMQLGQSQRRLGDFDAAIETFSSILLEREAMLDVQKAAAYTYQEWGEAQDTNQFDNAIRGARRIQGGKKNLIWGWSKLGSIAANVARRQPKYKDLFFESWLNIAKCRYLTAKKTSGSEKTKNLASAERTIRSMARQYPDLGGERRKQDFDQLLKQIQNERGEEPIGLKAI